MFSRRGNEDERQKKNKKSRFSSEYTMLSILEYLYTNTQNMSVSKYNIMTNTPGIRRQRPDRVNIMIDLLEKNGYIISLNTSSNLIFYKITRNGIDAYEKWIKDFLEFARTTNITNALDMASTTTNNESLKKDSDNSSNNVMMMTIL